LFSEILKYLVHWYIVTVTVSQKTRQYFHS